MAKPIAQTASIPEHQQDPDAHPKVVSVITGATGAVPLDFAVADVFDIAMVGNCTFSVVNPPAIGDEHTVEIIFRQDATGSRTATFPASWLFSGASKTLTTAASSIDRATVRSDPSVSPQKFLAELTKAYA